MEKEIRIFDTSNQVLKVRGIRFELFDVANGALLWSDNSHDLNPGPGGTVSNDWGVRLTFSAGNHPLEVYTSDPNLRYPGNTIQSLEGRQTDRIDIDLQKVPANLGGQSHNLSSAQPRAIVNWVQDAPKWNDEDKRAVLNLVFNYLRVIVPQLEKISTEYQELRTNWADTLSKLGISPDILEGTQGLAA